MKGYVRMILVATLLLLSTALLAALNVTGLWNPNFSWKVVGKTGPSIIAESGGNIIFLSKDGAAYELTTTGTLKSLGQTSGITNVVAPAAYVTAGGKNFLVYVTAQGTADNKLVVQKIVDGPASNGITEKISSSAYGVVAYADTEDPALINIYTATMDGKLYYEVFDATTTTFASSDTSNLSGPVKIPPLLSPAKDKLYVLTQNGDLYSLVPGSLDENPDPLKKYAGEFTVPMAMDETGYLYALNTSGRLYKIDPADGSEKHAEPLLGSDSSGVLIDGDGFIYVFGGKKVAVLNSNLLKLGEYSIGQSITTTPAIVKDSAGKTYVIVPSSESSSSGKITILSFDRVSGSLTKEWEYVVPSSFPISAAVDVAPTNELTNYYYFATATNDGTVYAWKFDGNGPYGIWACYGQNSNHTGFIDSTAAKFNTRIYLMAYEGFASRPLSSTSMGSYYGLLYDATIVNADGTTGASYTQLRTNEPDKTNKTKVPEGVPGSQKLEILFDTPTTATLLFTSAFTPKKGTLPVTEDATFSFARWQTGTNGYEGSNLTSKLATLTYRFSDRTVNLLTNATYTYYTYHKYSGAGEASKTDGTFNYNEYITDPSKAKITISASPIQQGQKWFPFKWVVYQWNPDNPNNYDKQTLGALDSLDLQLKGPAYIEIYYAQLSATITLLVPDFAYGRTPAYIFLDAAPNSIAYTMEATMLNGVTIEKVVGEEYAESLKKVQSSVTSDHIKYVFNGMEGPLADETRVATLAVNLLFPNKVDFSGGSTGLFEQYVNLYGYAQLQGQLIDSQSLMAKKVYSTNHYLYVLGDFNEDFYVDINDWNFFVEKYGTTVSGTDVIYNIGPRDEFVPPYPDYRDYRAGYLTDSTNAVNEEDLYVFASMFGFAVQEADRVQ